MLVVIMSYSFQDQIWKPIQTKYEWDHHANLEVMAHVVYLFGMCSCHLWQSLFPNTAEKFKPKTTIAYMIQLFV